MESSNSMFIDVTTSLQLAHLSTTLLKSITIFRMELEKARIPQ